MNDLRYHTPLSGVPRQREFMAFDIEGVGGPSGFWCGAICDGDGGRSYTDRAAMWDALRVGGQGYLWRVAHNLEYDLSVLAVEELLSGGATMGSSGLLWFDCEDDAGNPIRFIDSLNLFRGLSVERLGELVGLPKLELPGGMLKVMRNGFPWEMWSKAEQDLILEYNLRDAEIVYRAMVLLQEQILSMGGQLRETIAGTSHDLYRRSFMPHAWRTVGPATNESARLAYYGGRAEPHWMGINEHVNMYDVNSLYPSIMRQERFPDPGYLDLDTPGTYPGDLDRREGVALVDVRVPATPIPPLPARRAGSLFFPCGEWTGAYCLNELRHALDCGVEVTRWHWMISTRKMFNPFGDFVDALWDLRASLSQSNPANAELVKMLLNSHIGRYGIRPDPPLTTLEIVRDRFDMSRDKGLIWDQIGRWDYVERPVGDDHLPTYANVFFAAQVAAGARVFLHRAMVEQGSRLVYVDTDSVMTGGSLPTGTRLGEWKEVFRDGTANLIGPKEYAVLYEHDKFLYHAKGIPEKLAREYLLYSKVRMDQALSIRQARARQRWPASWVEVVKNQGSPTPKRVPVEDWPGTAGPFPTEAWEWSELQEERTVSTRVSSWRERFPQPPPTPKRQDPPDRLPDLLL